MRTSDSAFVGPFAALLYTPTPLASHFMNLFKALGKVPGLPPSARETAILATGAHYGAAYELYAHKAVAVTSGALSEQEAEGVASGKLPDGSGEDVRIALEVARALCERKGPLEDGLWRQAKEAFGLQGAAALVHYVGCYAYTSILLNGADTPVPE